MPDILSEIIANKRIEVELQKQSITIEQLYEGVFGYDAEGDSSAIAEHIKNIRAKLNAFGISPIETVWGVGYKWQKDSVR